MAEQFLKAYSIHIGDLFQLVGSRNKAIIKTIKKNKRQANDVDDLIREWQKKPAKGEKPFGLDQALNDIVAGDLDKGRAYEYLRTLELFLEGEGKLLPDEVVFPGRGWQEIGKEISEWGLPTLGAAWCSPGFSFPWKKENSPASPAWPKVTAITTEDVSKLRYEINNFDPKFLLKHPLPKRLQGLETEVESFIQVLKKWLGNSSKDLVLLLDGQQ